MRSFWLPILCILLSSFCSRQPAQGGDAPEDPALVWSELQEQWLRTEYGACLKSAGLRMSCGGCPAIIIDAEFVVDAQGRLGAVRSTRENVCGRKAPPALRACFFRFFRSKTFPPALRERTLQGKLGTGLGC